MAMTTVVGRSVGAKAPRRTSGMRSGQTLSVVIAALLGAAALSAARAQEEKSATEKKEGGVRVIQEADKVIVRKRTVIDFSDVTVEGELTKPEGSYLLNRNRAQFQS